MRRAVAALFLFGISFGYVEAAVVVYLRAIYDPIRRQIHPERKPGELFPLITSDELAKAGPENPRRLLIEVGREAATMVMLAAVALAVARNFHQWFAAFSIAFGVWDIMFYVFLKLMIHWPDSLSTWDILFLIPLPWVGPVWAPVLVALTMIVCGLIALRSESPRRDPAALARRAGGSRGNRHRIRVGLPKHQRGRASESVQLAAILDRRSDRAYSVSRCSKVSKTSGISKTARLTMAAALARKRAKLDASSSSRSPASISRNDFSTTPTFFSRIHSVL